MNPDKNPDVLVIGLGAVGSATVYQLARRGVRVTGIDRFTPPHDRGSSHGATRITRLAVGEGDDYVPLVQRSHAIWRELESESGKSLYVATGGLVMGDENGTYHHGQAGFVQRTIGIAERFGIAHEVLRADELAARFPQFVLDGSEIAYYEPEAGALRPEECVATQIDAARRHGATIRCDEQVLEVTPGGSGVVVRTDRDTYSAGRVIVTAGAWIPGLVGDAFATRLQVMRQVLYWFKPVDIAPFQPAKFPIFIWIYGTAPEDSFYGFPMVDGIGGVKMATEQYSRTTDPDHADRVVTAAETARMFQHNVAQRFHGITDRCVQAKTCLYTVSQDSGFVIDRHPSSPLITVVSACSGHAFKHSAGLGEALAIGACGEADAPDLTRFSLSRFATA